MRLSEQIKSNRLLRCPQHRTNISTKWYLIMKTANSFDDASEFLELIRRKIQEARDNMEHSNILLIGRTGAGKSTLINSVFGKDIAAVGVGKPCSTTFNEIRDVGSGKYPNLGLIDSRGLELKSYERIIQELEAYIKLRADNTDPKEHIHLAWICINESDRRVEQAQIDVAEMLHRNRIPCIVVITQAIRDKAKEYRDGLTTEVSFKQFILQTFPKAGEVIQVLSESFEMDFGVVPSHGLQELVDATVRLLPEGCQAAFIAAQKVDVGRKVDVANKFMTGSVAAAFALGVVPLNLTVPGTTEVGLVGIQVAMFASISLAFGLDIDKAFLNTLIASIAGSSTATLVGRELFRRVIELLPVGGQVVSSATGATIASTITATMGTAYINTLKYYAEKGIKPTPAQISDVFRQKMKEKK